MDHRRQLWCTALHMRAPRRQGGGSGTTETETMVRSPARMRPAWAGERRTICWKVDSEARMEPPIQTEYLRSGGATTLTFMEEGARAVISLFMRSAMPGNMVVPVQARGKGSSSDTLSQTC